ncbi:hypothetical protein DCO58_07105 [Helicobacter saguini]|uniref:Flagellar protein FliL n=1 Tax=Helicobacter saguini TaxID=1548018 RepID=A0A347VN51_9HELI|nr:flagellar basal body-associated FliL family protein [Helicobacter saguini]MWV61899.1 hypothetical protein [Helicobacter saguini]MWV67426.1 hypothetical protein [Helicobacter saguini]MWV69779.1 hypothetical protein [Helicobacter saguini]MWV73004.1 hypothetical protein [Helicobacter saguini]TLD95616.1 flagellar basal body-associated FliL family protein [Helicobacter saguini]
MAEEEKKEGENKEEKKGKGLLFIIIGVVVAVIILIAVIVFMFMGGDEESSGGGGHAGGGAAPQVANLSPEQQALLQNEAFKNPAAIQPLEKDFIVNLKSPNPDNMREGGFVKFKATLLLADKHTVKEVDAKLDIIRNVITDVASSFTASELQSAQGRQKFASAATNSVNSVLTDGHVAAIVFPDFVLQP